MLPIKNEELSLLNLGFIKLLVFALKMYEEVKLLNKPLNQLTIRLFLY